MRTYILDVPLDDLSLDEIANKVLSGSRVIQVFINMHKIVGFHTDQRLKTVISCKDSVCSLDGKWVGFMAALKHFYPKERFGGLEVIEKFFYLSQKTPLKIFLLGAKKSILEDVEKKLLAKFKGADIVGTRDGFFNSDDEVIKDIKSSLADVVFIALPSPKKELLNFKIFNEVAYVKYVAGVGGAFDIIAGKFRRAPKFIQDIGLEWLWRCFLNFRLFRRYIMDFLFVLWLMIQRLFKRL